MPRRRIHRNGGGRGGRLIPPPSILPYQPPPPDDILFDDGGVTPPDRDGGRGGLGGGIVDPADTRSWIAQRTPPQRFTTSAWQKWLEANRFRGRMKAPVINKDKRKSLLAVYPGPEAKGLAAGESPFPKYGRPDYFPANDPRGNKRRLYGGGR